MALSNIADWEDDKDKQAGAACGASDKPAACGTACGASDKPEQK
ncbi:ACGX-repeat peptide [Clostridium sp. OM05-9]|jgi:ACGX-repeat protein|nr:MULTISPECIES: ACGX-repeat peptide [unclassified Clostridium]RGG77279.1 ACGX-repeat peptide [Clostridium sp. AF17-21AC]RHR58054.1 ACGX-repeat peptide [Clostridium sp. AF17-2]RHV14029.1 ACGX-repeat peptide [Clostridium sp. OM05-9]